MIMRTIVKELTIKEKFSKLFSVKNKPGNCERKYNIRKKKSKFFLKEKLCLINIKKFINIAKIKQK